MQIKAGNYYKTRAGKKAYVSMVQMPNPFPHPDNKTAKDTVTLFPSGSENQSNEVVEIKSFPELRVEVEGYPAVYFYIQSNELPHHLYSCNIDGRRFNKVDSPYDLIEEWL